MIRWRLAALAATGLCLLAVACAPSTGSANRNADAGASATSTATPTASATPSPTDDPDAWQRADPKPATDAAGHPTPATPDPRFTRSVLRDGLDSPFQLTWGPDGKLWLTEKVGKVLRIDPTDGTVSTVLTLADMSWQHGQDGLLGMALSPNLLTDPAHAYVYLAYSYNPSKAAKPTIATERMKIVRFTYNAATHRLAKPHTLIQGLPASTDHDAGRLRLGPDGKLYYSIGDQGHLQFAYTCVTDEAQTLPTKAQLAKKDYRAYQGKTLRLNTDGSIPADNPMIDGVRSHIFTYGHRNPQGLAFAPDGTLYSSEQGPKTDDEINRLKPGGNYGWPNVAGYRDNKAYVFADWPSWKRCDPAKFSDLAIPAGVPQHKESSFHNPAFTPPLITFATVDNGYNFAPVACQKIYFVCWPTVAPSSLLVYTSDAIPGWQNSLLMPTLKAGTLYRLPLDDKAGQVGEPERLFRSVNRYRDVAVSPDGRTIYIATDNGGAVAGLDGTPADAVEDPGSILAFRYHGS